MTHRSAVVLVGILALAVLSAAAGPALAQQPPPYETRKLVDGVYIFRHVGHQSMFVVTPKA